VSFTLNRLTREQAKPSVSDVPQDYRNWSSSRSWKRLNVAWCVRG